MTSAKPRDSKSTELHFFEKELTEVKDKVSRVDEKVSNIQHDLAVIKTSFDHMIKALEKVHVEHDSHKRSVDKRFGDHEQRLSEIEKKQLSSKAFFGGVLLVTSGLFAVAVALLQIFVK